MPEIRHTVTLESLANGAIAEIFGHELERVLENIQDHNTVASSKRQLNLTFTLSPNSNRDYIEVLAKCISSCGGKHNEPFHTSLIVSQSGDITIVSERFAKQGELLTGQENLILEGENNA